MTTSEESGTRNGQKLDDIVRDADDYYSYLKRKHVSDTRLDTIVVSLVVWFASFAVIGLSAVALYGREIYIILVSFLIGIAIAAGAGLFTYFTRRRRGFKFAELGVLLDKMKQGTSSSEDGLRLMDSMHQAAGLVKKRKMDSAIKYGLITFAIVVIVGQNSAIAALAGIVAYLYFRFEALREYERGEERYEDSKKLLLQSL